VRENKSNVCPTLTANMGTGGHNVPIIRDNFGIRKLHQKNVFNKKSNLFMTSNKHQHYEILNLIGYGLAKFDNSFIAQFGFSTKTAFFEYFVAEGLVKTASTVKNRMDLFDPYFVNSRKGWWQKKDVYIHRKQLIDSLFGNEDVQSFADIVKMYLTEKANIQDFKVQAKPIVKSKFKQLQITGAEAEIYFLNNYQKIDLFDYGIIEDARLYGDGYDFQITTKHNLFLAEVKGIRGNKGKFRLTCNEYQKAREYSDSYIIAVVLNLGELSAIKIIRNPLAKLEFQEKIVKTKEVKEYHLLSDVSLDS